MTRARDVADTQDNVGGAVAPFVAAKNKVLNSDFTIWQRGTSFTNPTSDTGFTADRFYSVHNGTGATRTISRQAFTPGAAPVAGYEGQTFFRYDVSAAGTGNTYNYITTSLEDVRTFAGQTVTFSFWAKANTNLDLAWNVDQFFGSGGSAVNYNAAGFPTTPVSITTSWQRYSRTFTMASISGKTIGTSNYLRLWIAPPPNTTFTVDTWGWQLEAGSVATPFTTATGNPASELAACERYYQVVTGQMLTGINANVVGGSINFRTQMRTGPSVALSAAMNLRDSGADYAQTSANVSITSSRTNERGVQIEMANFPGTITANRPYFTNVTLSQIQFSAEL